jgi:hypothetical protein
MTAGSTAVEFTWDRDRWRHAVMTAAGRLDSLEGEVDDRRDARWPASPALIEVSLAEAAGGPAVLGVGQAGRSHFSLSIRPCPERNDTFLFEAACRIHESAVWLGSTYRDRAGRVTRVEAALLPAPATVTWSYRIGPAGVEPTPHQPTAPAE